MAPASLRYRTNNLTPPLVSSSPRAADSSSEERTLQRLALKVGEARSADEVLRNIVDGLVAEQDIALARVWLADRGDICESCRLRNECFDQSRCLHLAASAGRSTASDEDWSRITGDFRRMPFNARKVGVIGASGEPILIANSLAENRWIARPEWARREGIVSFAGQPLMFRGETLGVLAIFRRSAISEHEFEWLRIFADHAAIAIANARAFDEVARLRHQLELERDYLREEVREALAFGEIVGKSAALRSVLEQVDMVAPTDATVLILGESGTGKELVASAIHEHSPRREHPLIRVNCGSIPSELFESEFFGHARGSFTGAMRDRVGRFQHADGGTLFLDEVGEIPLAHQAKLLRVLQEGQFERVGEDTTRKVNVRIVAATNRDLKAEVAAGRFRQDLYYRLSVFPMELPPLRERREDIAALTSHFATLSCDRLKRPAVRFTDEDLDLLRRYQWPGNIRELQNVIERAVILAKGPRPRLDLALVHTADAGSTNASRKATSSANDDRSQPAIMRNDELLRLERENMITALEYARWKVSGSGSAAELLGLNANTLASRMRALGIRRSRTPDKDS
jgi:transcriptional regulator with GAF, ATPase, and Fis domain